MFQHHQIASPDGLELFENIYISKKFDLAAKLRNVFIEMWSTMDDFGQVLDRKTWIRTSRQIGRMLGYPDTAIDGFIRDRIEYRTGDDSLTVIAGKYRTFAHSKKYLKKEIKAYDEPLEKAVKKYAPKTYALFEEADCGFSFNDSRVRKALEIALEKGKYSTSLVQVYVGLGQSTTSKLTIWLEKNKIISPSNGNRPRDLLIRDMADAEKILFFPVYYFLYYRNNLYFIFKSKVFIIIIFNFFINCFFNLIEVINFKY